MIKPLIAERFAKAIATYPQEASVQQQIANKMIHLLKEHIPLPCPRVLEFGCGTGAYSRLLRSAVRPEQLVLNDLCADMKHCCVDLLADSSISFAPGDAETISFSSDHTLITSCSALQWFEQPERFFIKCYRSLVDEGYLAFSTFGLENMKEIRILTGHGLDYRSLTDLKTALAPYYDMVYAEEELIPVRFDHPMQVLYHLKQTGVNGLSASSAPWTRADLNDFCHNYVHQFAFNNTTVPLTYHPIYIIAKKKRL